VGNKNKSISGAKWAFKTKETKNKSKKLVRNKNKSISGA
jgi:hypothetical protein